MSSSITLNRIIVVLSDQIFVYNYSDKIKLIEVIETCPNPNGICAVSSSKDVFVLATPEVRMGTVKVIHFDKELKTKQIEAHDSGIAAICLN